MSDTRTADFRAELTAFFTTDHARLLLGALHAPGAWDDPSRATTQAALYELLGEHRLLAPSLPEEYGGRGLDADAAAAVAEELVAHGVPDMAHVISVQTVGTVLLAAADPRQQQTWLPGLASGRQFAAVLFTEPGSGSDLSSLSTTAVRVDGGYELTGVKAYCLNAGAADLGLCLARVTDDKADHSGGTGDLALFLVPLKAPGINRTPLGPFLGDRFYRVDLDRVELSADALVGGERDGLRLLLRVLVTERTGIDYYARARHWFAVVQGLAAGALAGTVPLAPLARLGAEVEAAHLLAYRSLRAMLAGKLSEGAAALSKWYTSDLAARVAWAGAEWIGSGPPLPGTAELLAAQREAPGLLVSGGVSEILLETLGRLRVQQPGAGELLADEGRALERELRRAIADAVAHPLGSSAGLAELGAPGFGIPVEAGGMDLGQTALLMVCVELGRAAMPPGFIEGTVATDILTELLPNPERQALLGEIAEGKTSVGLLVDDGTPGGRLHAVRTADGWTVSGPARLHGPAAPDLLLLIADTTPGEAPLLALIAADCPEVVRTGPGPDRGANPGAIERVELRRLRPDPLPVADPAHGQRRQACASAELRHAGYLVGLGSGALDLAGEHLRSRRQFGRPLAELPGVAAKIALLASRAEVVLLLLQRVAEQQDDSTADPRQATEALALAAEFALEATREAVHVHGARGVAFDHPVQRFYLAAATQAGRHGNTHSLWERAGNDRVDQLRTLAPNIESTQY